MKELDITKAYYLGDLDEFHRGVVFDYLLNIDHTFKTTRKIDFQKIDTDYIFYHTNEWEWYTKIEFIEEEVDLDVVNALTLFKPQFKQGDKVLYTDDLVNWEEGVFLVKHNESYIIESDEMLFYAIEIKPYEDEIKVGDWFKRINDETIWKIRNKDDINVALNSEFTKITNPELIKLLNNEL